MRPPRMDDAEAILGMITAHNTPLIGFADFTLDDVRDELAEPGYDPETDGWLVFDPKDRLVGYGWACRIADSDQIDVDATALEPEVAHWLFERAIARARAIGAELGHSRMTIDQGIYRADEPMRQLAASYGFQPSTTYHRMRIDHTGPVPMPSTPSGVVIRTGSDVAPAAYELVMASFAEHHGHVEMTYDEWLKATESRSVFNWSYLTVLEIDGKPVAFSQTNDQFLEDDNCGYVLKLGVLPEARGRGLAKFLLQRVFAIDAAAGRDGTILHVDTNNTTPALGLYTSVGMRPFLVIDVWRQVLSAQ